MPVGKSYFYKGETRLISAWAIYFGVSAQALSYHFKNKSSAEAFKWGEKMLARIGVQRICKNPDCGENIDHMAPFAIYCTERCRQVTAQSNKKKRVGFKFCENPNCRKLFYIVMNNEKVIYCGRNCWRSDVGRKSIERQKNSIGKLPQIIESFNREKNCFREGECTHYKKCSDEAVYEKKPYPCSFDDTDLFKRAERNIRGETLGNGFATYCTATNR